MTRLLALPSCRKRENSLQEDRGSFVTTPTAELSSQEDMLLGSFLDWSLDYCSGYEGDQESEGEKDGDGEHWDPETTQMPPQKEGFTRRRHERAEPLEHQSKAGGRGARREDLCPGP